MAVREQYDANVQTLFSEAAGQRLRGALTAAVRIGIEGQVDGARTVTQLPKLPAVEVRSHRAGDVAKPRLPQ